jgi:hypothetical protein
MKNKPDNNIIGCLVLLVISAYFYTFPLLGIVLEVIIITLVNRSYAAASNKKLAKIIKYVAIAALIFFIAESIYLIATFQVG